MLSWSSVLCLFLGLSVLVNATCGRLVKVGAPVQSKSDEHVKNILTICNQRCYLLKCLPSAQLNIVFVP